MMKIAFAGFRHGHINGLYDLACKDARLDVVGACEDHAPTAQAVRAEGKVKLTHADYREMFAQSGCDAVAVGDYYGRRGEVIIAALEAGKHVIGDKPLCTRLDELKQISQLVDDKGLSVGCMLTMRDSGKTRAMRRLVAEGTIGEVHTISFSGQHPLLWGKRPDWYFEQGCHGGTINDIAIHAVDILPWMTGRRLVEVVAARVWNARLAEVPHFQDGAQMMLRLDNGGGVMGDVSYLAPDKGGYAMPQYWRFTLHGPGGVLECSVGDKKIMIGGSDDKPRYVSPDADNEGGYLESFLADVEGRCDDDMLTTSAVLDSTRLALEIQAAADQGRFNAPLETSDRV